MTVDRAVGIGGPGCPLCRSPRASLVASVKERLLGTGEVFSLMRCGGCGLIRTDPRPAPADMAGYYPEHYAPHQPSSAAPAAWLRDGVKGVIRRYTLAAHAGYPLADLRGSRRWVVAGLTRPLRGRYVMFPPFRPGGRLLEVGSATGERLALLRGLGWEVSGVETSERACRLAKALYGLQVFHGELHEACLPPASMDAVLFSHVLEHVYDPLATLSEIRRILAPGGVLVVETPNAGSLGCRVFGSSWYEWDVPRHLFLFDARTLALACERVGLRLERLVYAAYTGDWDRSLGLWCRDRGWSRLADWLASRRRALELLLRPAGRLLAWTGAAGRLIAIARAR